MNSEKCYEKSSPCFSNRIIHPLQQPLEPRQYTTNKYKDLARHGNRCPHVRAAMLYQPSKAVPEPSSSSTPPTISRRMIRSAQTAASAPLIPAFRKGLAACIRALPPTLAMTTRYGWTLVPVASLHSGDLRYLNPLRPSNRSGSAILGLKLVQAAEEE